MSRTPVRLTTEFVVTGREGAHPASAAGLNSLRHGYKNGYKSFSAGSGKYLQVIGANGEGRTPIPSREPDPKSGASANSATFAFVGPLDRLYRGYSPCPEPQTETSNPISRNMAALTASANLAPFASGA